MSSRVQVTFRRSRPSDLMREVVSQKFNKLASQLPHTARCHVVLDRPIASHHKGAPFTARVDIQGAGTPICTEADNLDPFVAIRAAFERAETQARRTRATHDRASKRAFARASEEHRAHMAPPSEYPAMSLTT
jgi:putative sigma-54 modulation protein